jgi:hypothetical protein
MSQITIFVIVVILALYGILLYVAFRSAILRYDRKQAKKEKTNDHVTVAIIMEHKDV